MYIHFKSELKALDEDPQNEFAFLVIRLLSETCEHTRKFLDNPNDETLNCAMEFLDLHDRAAIDLALQSKHFVLSAYKGNRKEDLINRLRWNFQEGKKEVFDIGPRGHTNTSWIYTLELVGYERELR